MLDKQGLSVGIYQKPKAALSVSPFDESFFLASVWLSPANVARTFAMLCASVIREKKKSSFPALPQMLKHGLRKNAETNALFTKMPLNQRFADDARKLAH